MQKLILTELNPNQKHVINEEINFSYKLKINKVNNFIIFIFFLIPFKKKLDRTSMDSNIE